MPLIVDKRKEQTKILDAFERCIEDKPIFNITLRDIAKKANMSHPKLLSYFPSKHDLIEAYCQYTKDYMVEHCRKWFSTHLRTSYETNLAYLSDFLRYIADGEAGENRPNATVQTYVLAKYDPKIAEIVEKEFAAWRAEMEQHLSEIYGSAPGAGEAEAMMALITGIFTCNYTGALTGSVNDSFLQRLKALSVE